MHEARASDETAPPSPQSPKRAMPDYDGLGMPDTKSDNAGVWLARVLLSPLYFVSELVIRRPAEALLNALDSCDCMTHAYETFSFGAHHKLGFVPVGFVDAGFYPGIGVYGHWNDAPVSRNDMRLHYELWPAQWFGGSLTDRYRLDDRRWVQLRVTATRRPDQVFYGVGPTSLQSQQSRYGIARFDLSGAIEAHGWRSTRVRGTLGVRKVDVFPGHYADDPSLEQAAAAGAFEVPWGFNRGYTAPYSDLRLTLDSREPGKERGSSARVEVESEQGADAAHQPVGGWVRYGASAGAFIDLNDHGRILGVQLAALFADPLGNQPVPFTELVSLGGDVWMQGYFPGRLVGRSATVAALGYEWPIAAKLDAKMQAVFGNVFGAYFQGFDPSLLRFSAAIGLTTRTIEPPLEILVGFGTETFEHGAQVDSVRFVIGVPRSF